MIALIVHILYFSLAKVPFTIIRVVIDTLNRFRKIIPVTVLIIKLLWIEYFIYAIFGFLAIVFKGGIIESIHNVTETLYYMQLDDKMQAWWDSMFSAHGTFWNFLGSFPNTTGMIIAKIAFGLCFFGFCAIMTIVFSILLNYKIFLVVFIPELIFRIIKSIATGEPMVLCSPNDFYNPFNPDSITKKEKESINEAFDHFYGYTPENEQLIREMEEYKREQEQKEIERQELERLCPGALDTECERHLQKVKEAQEFKAWRERNQGKETAPWKPSSSRQTAQSSRASSREDIQKYIPKTAVYFTVPSTGEDISAKNQARLDSQRIAKRQAQRQADMRANAQRHTQPGTNRVNTQSRPNVPGVRYSDTQYYLKPKK